MIKRWPSGRIVGWSGGTAGSASMVRQLQPNTVEVHEVELPPMLRKGERGVLTMPVVEIDGTSVNPKGFDPDATRCAVLLFDQVVHPANTAISVGDLRDVTGDIKGVSDRRLRMSARGVEKIFSTALTTMFEKLEEREPGLWSLARGTNGFNLPEGLLGGMNAFRLKLENALPMPDREVPYEDVAKYRERRHAELMALRHYIEGLALEVEQHGHSNLAQTRAFEQFQAALGDHARAIQETNWLKRAISLDLTFNWTDAASKLLPILLGSFDLKLGLGALVGSVSIESARGLRKSSAKPSPFDYVFSAGNAI